MVEVIISAVRYRLSGQRTLVWIAFLFPSAQQGCLLWQTDHSGRSYPKVVGSIPQAAAT